MSWRQRALVVRTPTVLVHVANHGLNICPTFRVGAQVLLHLLVDGRVHEHGEDNGRWSVDRHRNRCRGIAKIEARIELLHIVQCGDAHAGVADFPVDIWPLGRILSIQRY